MQRITCVVWLPVTVVPSSVGVRSQARFDVLAFRRMSAFVSDTRLWRRWPVLVGCLVDTLDAKTQSYAEITQAALTATTDQVSRLTVVRAAPTTLTCLRVARVKIAADSPANQPARNARPQARTWMKSLTPAAQAHLAPSCCLVPISLISLTRHTSPPSPPIYCASSYHHHSILSTFLEPNNILLSAIMKGVIGLALAAAASASPVLLDSTMQRGEPAPVITATNAKAIPDSYMIKFKPHVTHTLATAHHNWVQELHLSSTANRKLELKKRSQEPLAEELFAGLKHTYNIAGSLLGYSGHFDESVIEEIRKHPDVSAVAA